MELTWTGLSLSHPPPKSVNKILSDITKHCFLVSLCNAITLHEEHTYRPVRCVLVAHKVNLAHDFELMKAGENEDVGKGPNITPTRNAARPGTIAALI